MERLVEDIVRTARDGVDGSLFVIGDFGEDPWRRTCRCGRTTWRRGHRHRQTTQHGTHAIFAAKTLDGLAVVSFADTLFRADFTIDPEADGVLFCQRIDDPSAFGVVVTNDDGKIADYVEKPQEWVGDLAMVDIYAFKDMDDSKGELQHLGDHNIIKGGEYRCRVFAAT